MNDKYFSAEDIKYQLSNLHQLTFEVTDQCNLQCRYCAYGEFYNDYDKRDGKMISLPAAINLINYLVPFWSSSQNASIGKNIYISFYGGEPLLNMTFVRSIVEYIENLECRYRKFTFSMTTNALLLDRYMDFLVEHNFNLLISLDGNEYNTSYRVNKAGESCYNRVIKNVDLLRKNHPQYFENKVNFNSVLHNRNSVQEIYSFFKKHYNKIPSIGELNNTGIQPDKVQLFNDTYRNSYQSLHQAENYEEIERNMFLKSGTYQSLTTFIHQYSGFVFRNYSDLLYGIPKKIIPTGTCIPFSRRMFVTVNGKILPCEKIGQQYALGYITEKSINIDFEAIADKYNNYLNKLKNQCNKCYSANICTQCIFNLVDIDSNPVCHGFTNKSAFEAYKAIQIDFLRKNPKDYYRIMEEVTVD